MPEVAIRLPRLHPRQRAIAEGMGRFNVVCCGRRFGKTVLAMDRAVRPLMAGEPVGWFAPTYKYLADPWRAAVRTFGPLISHQDKTERRIELVTGGALEFWTLEDPDAGRSRHYRRAIIDEAAKCRHLDAAWNEGILPTLADLRGDADFYSTPKGRNYFHTLAARGMDRAEGEWTYHHAPTQSNPHIPAESIADMRRAMPSRVYSQEVDAVFVEDGGGVFRNVLAAVDVGRTAADEPRPGLIYSQGTDLARVEDFTVDAILDPFGRQVYHARGNQISWARQIERIAAASRRYNRAAITLDSTGVGDPIFEQLRALAGVGPVKPFVFTHASKERLIDNLALLIEQGKVRLMDVPEQTNELLGFEYDLTPSGKVTTSAPDGSHDDCVIALALACWGHHTHKRRIELS